MIRRALAIAGFALGACVAASAQGVYSVIPGSLQPFASPAPSDVLFGIHGGAFGGVGGTTSKFTVAAVSNAPCGSNALVLTCAPYSAAGNGTTDDTLAVQSAIAAAASNSGGIIYSLPGKTYAVSSTLAVTNNNIRFVCLGSPDGFHNSGLNYPSCAFKWIGAAGGTLMRIQPVISTSNPTIDGNGVDGFAFQSNNGLAAVGLTFAAANHGVYQNLYFDQFSSIALQCNAISTVLLQEAGDSQYNDIRNITIRNYSNSGVGLSLDGTVNSDCSLNNFTGIESETYNGNAVSLNISDNNNFFLVSSSALGTGDSLFFSSSTGGNTFHNWLGNKAPVLQAGSQANTIYSYESQTNGVPFPTPTSSAFLNISDDRGVQYFYGYSSFVADIGDASIINCRANTLFDPNASINACNESGDNLNLLSGSYRAGFGFDGSGNLRVVINGGKAFSTNGEPLLAGASTFSGTVGLTVATWADNQTCTAGQISVDASYVYVCTATNTVKRAALATF